jgi:raffinose/stachyose/melibiose transport system permease protein
MRIQFHFRRTAVQVLRFASSLIILYPLSIVILGALKDKAGAARMSFALPERMMLIQNLQTVFENANVGTGFRSSIIIAAGAVTGTLLVAGVAAFVLQRRSTRLSSLLFSLFLLGMIIPGNIIANFRIMLALNLYGTLLAPILLLITGMIPVNLFLFHGYFKSLPRELDEAAYMEGCPVLVFYGRVMLPLAAPMAATSAIIVFLTAWNAFVMPLYFLTNPDLYTLPLSIYYFVGEYTSDWNLVFTDILVVAAPIVLVFLLLQRYIISGLTGAAVKG